MFLSFVSAIFYRIIASHLVGLVLAAKVTAQDNIADKLIRGSTATDDSILDTTPLVILPPTQFDESLR